MPLCLVLNTIRYVSKVKWSNPGKGVAPFPTPQCSSYWKGSLPEKDVLPVYNSARTVFRALLFYSPNRWFFSGGWVTASLLRFIGHSIERIADSNRSLDSSSDIQFLFSMFFKIAPGTPTTTSTTITFIFHRFFRSPARSTLISSLSSFIFYFLLSSFYFYFLLFFIFLFFT